MHQHVGLGGQHVQVGRQTRFVTLRGDVIGRVRRRLRSLLFGALAGNGLQRGQLVSHLVHGFNHRAVVTVHRGVQVCVFGAQVGTQAAPVKNRQPDRRAHAALFAVALQQPVQPDAGEPGESHQVHVGVKLRLGVHHVFAGGLCAPTGSGHVGAQAQQVSGQLLRHSEWLERSQRRRTDRGSVLGRSGQRGNGLLGQRDLLLQRFNLLAHFGQAAFTLAQFQGGVQPGVNAVSHQR